MATGEDPVVHSLSEETTSMKHKEEGKCKSVMLNRNCLARNDISSTVPNEHDVPRKRKFNGEERENKDRCQKQEKKRKNPVENGQLSPKKAVASPENILQENIVTSAPETFLESIQNCVNTLRETEKIQLADSKEEVSLAFKTQTNGLDENSNPVVDGSEPDSLKIMDDSYKNSDVKQDLIPAQQCEESKDEFIKTDLRACEEADDMKTETKLLVSCKEQVDVTALKADVKKIETKKDKSKNDKKEKSKDSSIKAKEGQNTKGKKELETEKRENNQVEKRHKEHSEKMKEKKDRSRDDKHEKTGELKSKESMKSNKENKEYSKQLKTLVEKSNRKEEKESIKKISDITEKKEKGHVESKKSDNAVSIEKTKSKEKSHKNKMKDKDGTKNEKNDSLKETKKSKNCDESSVEGTMKAAESSHASLKIEASEERLEPKNECSDSSPIERVRLNDSSDTMQEVKVKTITNVEDKEHTESISDTQKVVELSKAKHHGHKSKLKQQNDLKKEQNYSLKETELSGKNIDSNVEESIAKESLNESLKDEPSEKPIKIKQERLESCTNENDLDEKNVDITVKGKEELKVKDIKESKHKKDKEGHAKDKHSNKKREREGKGENDVERKKSKELEKERDIKTHSKKEKGSSKVDEKERVKQNKASSSRKRKSDQVGDGVTGSKKTKTEKKKEEDSKWKWWEEEHYEDGVKWKFLEHKGPYFAPLYEPLPDDVHFCYDGKPMKLSLAAEEVATFYGKMLDHEYTTKEAFQNNFFTDWKTQMTSEERKTIKHLYKCDFSEIHKYYFEKNEARKALPKEEKQKLKEESSRIQEEYGYCMLDGHREKIGNFKTEPPGLFRGRGDHPKMGMLKLRIMPEDVIINCSKESKIPEPPPGHKWKEVRCDNTVTWLASWTENIQSAIKYIMLNPSSKLKGEKDWQKYETARRLKEVVGQIRSQYRLDWKSREMKKRQRAVALYFIDKLALRAGNEKEEGETADTVGCCSLRVEHIQLHKEMDGKQYVVEFDFLGKDSIRYYNKVPVEKEVFKNLKLFMENKNPDDDLFDRLNTTTVNKHLQDLMDGLTAKVFRTYNASITLQNQLKELTDAEDNIPAKILSYNRANRAVALLCNHQRAPPKTFEKSMQNLQTKIDAKEVQLKEAKRELKSAKADQKARKDEKSKKEVEKKKKLCERLKEQLMKLTLQATDKEENKQIALGTSKLNYLDPRITVAWCKKYGVPIEKIYNKTQRDKFAWAIDMTEEDFEF